MHEQQQIEEADERCAHTPRPYWPWRRRGPPIPCGGGDATRAASRLASAAGRRAAPAALAQGESACAPARVPSRPPTSPTTAPTQLSKREPAACVSQPGPRAPDLIHPSRRRRRKAREQKAYSKQVQAQKTRERAAEKKRQIEAVSQLRKQRQKSVGQTVKRVTGEGVPAALGTREFAGSKGGRGWGAGDRAAGGASSQRGAQWEGAGLRPGRGEAWSA
jgi:hypothetical protein